MKPMAKAADKKKGRRPTKSAPARHAAKSAGLAKVDELLGKPGARGAGKPLTGKTAPGKTAKLPQSRSLGATAIDAAPSEPTRFERCVARAERGEMGPIRILDLVFDPEISRQVRIAGRVEMYKKILRSNPSAQPGRPLVNVVGTRDDDLTFHLLSLHELVLAAQELGRETVQVALVRIGVVEAAKILAKPTEATPVAEKKALTVPEIAAMNGFLELAISDILRTENIRQGIDTEAPEFLNLTESIRTIGLQNPPVVEVRGADSAKAQLVCVSGHRRLLALETIGESRVTCALKLFRTERHRALAALAENINREDLHFLDKADGYGALVKHGMAAGEIAALLDSDVRTVGKYVRASGWDQTVKRRVRELGPKATTRFLLNMLAAGERTTAELHALIDRYIAGATVSAAKPVRGGELKRKLGEFYQLTGCTGEQRAVVEKALRFLGFLT